ncbi:MAG: outer membrane beta-barrel protein [Bacteriovorax sp.]|nr:outer membrane beta-barrel protein [Bacteriovorax sp.]
MLNKILKIVLITPVLMTGVFISDAQAQQQMKPNIHVLTGEASAKKVSNDIPSAGFGSSASEQRIPGDINKHSIGIGLGQTFLRSDFHEHGADKITPDIYYNYSASYSFDFMANAHWSKHKFQNKDVTIKGLALSIKGKGFQFDAFAPFVLGGFGFYEPQATRNIGGTLTKTREQLVFGMNIGAGVELRLNSEWTVGVIAHYHDPFSVRQDINGDLDGSYMKLLILGMYTFN